MARKRMSPRIKRALKRKEQLRKRMEEGERIVKEQMKKWKTPKKLFEQVIGRRPQGTVDLHRIKGGIIFEVQPGEFAKLCDRFKVPKEPKSLGFATSRLGKGVKIPGLRGRVGFIERRFSIYGEKRLRERYPPILDRLGKTILHEEHHILVPEIEKIPEIFKKPRHYKKILSLEVQEEVGAYLAEKFPQVELDVRLKYMMRRKRKEMEEEIEEMTDKVRLIEDTDASSKYKRTCREALNKSYKEADNLIKLVGECRKKGVPPDVLSQLVITTEWGDLPKTLKRLFDVR